MTMRQASKVPDAVLAAEIEPGVAVSQRVGTSMANVGELGGESLQAFLWSWDQRRQDIPFHRERGFLDDVTAEKWDQVIQGYISFAEEHSDNGLRTYMWPEASLCVLYAAAVDKALVMGLPKPEGRGPSAAHSTTER